GTFTDIAPALGADACWGTMSGNAGDLANSGRLGLLLGNGDPSMDRNEASMLYEHAIGPNGPRLRNVTFRAGLPAEGKGHGVNLADLTGDGRLHLIVGAGGLYPGDLLTTGVYRPRTRPGAYLRIHLEGTASNRDGIGARLAIAPGDGRMIHRLVSGGSAFGWLPLAQHVGLGPDDAARDLRPSMTVTWPSGRIDHVVDLPINAAVRVIEGENRWRSAAG
ncbi:MAG: ASPIC/UnbV domain-containing protein, partial [Acidobacteriota bacterium]